MKPDRELLRALRIDPRLLRLVVRIGMPTGGAVRASLGIATNFADVYRFIAFAAEFRDVTEVPADLPPRLACYTLAPAGHVGGAPAAAQP